MSHCPSCDEFLEEEWGICPYCGASAGVETPSHESEERSGSGTHGPRRGNRESNAGNDGRRGDFRGSDRQNRTGPSRPENRPRERDTGSRRGRSEERREVRGSDGSDRRRRPSEQRDVRGSNDVRRDDARDDTHGRDTRERSTRETDPPPKPSSTSPRRQEDRSPVTDERRGPPPTERDSQTSQSRQQSSSAKIEEENASPTKPDDETRSDRHEASTEGIDVMRGETVLENVRPAWSNWSKQLLLSVVFVCVGAISGVTQIMLVMFGLAAMLFLLVFASRSSSRYVVTDQRIRENVGLLSSSTGEIRVSDVQGVQTSSGLLEGLGGNGTIHVTGGGAGNTIDIESISDYKGVANTIREQQRARD